MSYAEAIFGRQIGAGLVTPGDVLAYRAAWDRYVLDTVRVSLDCGASMQTVAAANPGNSESKTLAALGALYVKSGNDLLAKWNVWQNVSQADIVIQAADILQNQQQVVLDAGKQRETMLAGPVNCGPTLTYHDASGQVVAAVTEPDPSSQAQIIARIEGLSILGQGILQILVTGATGALLMAGSAAQYVAKHLAATGSWLLSPWTWGAAALLLFGSVAVIAYNADKVGRAAMALRPLPI